jgi:Zn-dependent protease with chaperone function
MWRLKARLRPVLLIHFAIRFTLFLVLSWAVLYVLLRLDPVSVTATGFLLAIALMISEYLMGSSIVLSHLNPRWLRKEDDPVLWSLIDGESKASGIEIARVGLIDAKTPNALVIATTRGQPCLVFTRGLLSSLGFRELRVVVAWMLGASESGFLWATTMFSGLLALSYRLTGSYIERRIKGGRQNPRDRITAAIGYLPFAFTLPQSVRASRPMSLLADEFALESTGDPAAVLTSLLKVSMGVARNPRGENRSRLTPLKGLMFVDPTLALRDNPNLAKAARSHGIDTDGMLDSEPSGSEPTVGGYHVFEWYRSQPSPVDRFRRAIGIGRGIRFPIKIGFAWIE